MDETSVKIFTFYYKPGPVITSDPVYFPVFAGKNGGHKSCSIQGDDTGDNISSKNRFYSELTGIYWAWKNTRCDIVGTCHYRRYFTASEEPFSHRLKKILYYPSGIFRNRSGLIYTSDFEYWTPKILSGKEIIKLMETYDAILPVRRTLRKNVRHHFNKHHNPADLVILEQILKEYFPDYLTSFETVLNETRLFANNMFILRWEMFNKLMEWLFAVFNKFEERINLDDYKGYQERIFGFLSERLITLWISHNKINYKELPLIYFKKLKSD